MSDIALRSIGRQPPEQAGVSHSYTGNMTTSRPNQDGKRIGKYIGDPEEEAGLLYDDAEDEYDELRGAMSLVCQLFYISTFLVDGSAVEKPGGTAKEFRTPREGR